MALESQQGVLVQFYLWPLARGLGHCAPGSEHIQLAEHVRVDREGIPADNICLHGRFLGLEGRSELQLRLASYGCQRGVSARGREQ